MDPSAETTGRTDWPEGLPVRDPGISFWMASTRGFVHLTEGADAPLPAQAATVVIGSGLAGSLATFHLLASGAQNVVMLEARDACSCASARNGGHVRPDPFYGFPGYERLHGTEQARKILENERVVLEELARFVEQYKVDCDFERLLTLNTALSDEWAKGLRAAYEQYKAAGGSVDHIKFFDGEDAVKKSRVPQAKAVSEYPAATVNPAKLCQFLVASNIENGLQLFTHTPALAVDAADSGKWSVKTPRGTITATRVLHATNAFASFLLPELKGSIAPNKSQCLAIVPSRPYAGARRLTSSQGYMYSSQHYWYSMQRKQDGIIVLGVSRFNPDLDEATKRLLIEERALDKRALPGLTENALTAWHKLHPDFGKPDDLVEGEGLQMAWSGVIASTVEGIPFIGEVPGKAGQWICAGWSGHGMSRIWTGAPAVATLMSGGKWADTGLPECFELTPERLARSRDIAAQRQ